MLRRTTRTLALCLALLCCAGLAIAEEGTQMVFDRIDIQYDGTLMVVKAPLRHADEAKGLLDAYILDLPEQAVQGEQEMLDSGRELMGVRAHVQLLAGGEPAAEHYVFTSDYDAATGEYAPGFVFLLTPDEPREGLSVQVEANLVETAEGVSIEQVTLPAEVPASMGAETWRIKTDVETAWTKVDEVYVSSSQLGLCVFLHADGDFMYEMGIVDPESGEVLEPSFVLVEGYEVTGPQWSMLAYLDGKLKEATVDVRVREPLPGGEYATLRVDLAAETVTVVE